LVFIFFFRGILLFLIFGSNERPALFLPFCYYLSPDKPTRYPDEHESFYTENGLSSSTTTTKADESSEFDAIKIKNNAEIDNGASSSKAVDNHESIELYDSIELDTIIKNNHASTSSAL